MVSSALKLILLFHASEATRQCVLLNEPEPASRPRRACWPLQSSGRYDLA